MSDDIYNNSNEETSSNVIDNLQEPPLYKVFLHNDNYTTMEFVVEILESVFHKSASESTQIMLNVHKKGIGLCGVFPFEIAETKVATVKKVSEENGYPLLCTMEKDR